MLPALTDTGESIKMIKGGALANPNDEIKQLFKKARPDLSIASWGIRYAASLEGVITLLSGMSNEVKECRALEK